MFLHRELRRWGKFCCKILRNHAQPGLVFAPLEARRTLLQIFIKTTPHHRLAGLVSDRVCAGVSALAKLPVLNTQSLQKLPVTRLGGRK
jgi:hypothetical protein